MADVKEAEQTVRKLATDVRLRGMRILASVEGLSPEPGGNEQTRVVSQERLVSLMMRTFVSHISGMGKKTIHLTCKERHVGLCERLGYSYVKGRVPIMAACRGTRW